MSEAKAMKTPWHLTERRAHFSLYRHEDDPDLWQVRSRGCVDKYIRRRVRATTLDEALDAAAQALDVPNVVEGQEVEEQGLPTILDCMEAALAETTRRRASRQFWDLHTEKFLVWLQEHHSDCETWDKLTRPIVREYIKSLNGKSPNTIRLYTQPVRQTAAYMAREHGVADVAKGLGTGTRLCRTPPIVHIKDVSAFVGWLKKNRPHLEVGVALQGLAGLQLQEAYRLTWDRVDLNRGWVEISGETKNEYRERVIPVCSRVLEALKCAHERRQDRIDRNDAIPWRKVIVGCRWHTYNDWRAYSGEIRKALRTWNPQIAWAPKDLRNALPTFATIKGFHSPLWEQYIGHSPNTVTTRHYVPRLTSTTAGEGSLLEERMQVFKEQVVARVEAAISEQPHQDA